MVAFSDLQVLDKNYRDFATSHPVTYDVDLLDKTKIFGSLDRQALDYVFSEGKVAYNHDWSVTADILQQEKYRHLQTDLIVFAYSQTGVAHDGRKFVAAFEHARYPVFGMQFHPEVVQYERRLDDAYVDRSSASIRFAADIIETMVELSRQHALQVDDIPSWIKPHFASFMQSIRAGMVGYSRIYLLNNLYRDVDE